MCSDCETYGLKKSGLTRVSLYTHIYKYILFYDIPLELWIHTLEGNFVQAVLVSALKGYTQTSWGG